MPEDKIRKGFVNPLSIFGIGFLVVSLLVATLVVNKGGSNFDIRKLASETGSEYPTPVSQKTPTPTSGVVSNPESLGCSSCNCSGISHCPYGGTMSCTPPASCNTPATPILTPVPTPTANNGPVTNPESLGCGSCSCGGTAACPYGARVSCVPPASCKNPTPAPTITTVSDLSNNPYKYIITDYCAQYPERNECHDLETSSLTQNKHQEEMIKASDEYIAKGQKACRDNSSSKACSDYKNYEAMGSVILAGYGAIFGGTFLEAGLGAISSAPAWVQTGISAAQTIGGYTFVGGGTAACLTGNQEACFAYLGMLQGDPTSYAYAGQVINQAVTGVRNLATNINQNINTYLNTQINEMLPNFEGSSYWNNIPSSDLTPGNIALQIAQDNLNRGRLSSPQRFSNKLYGDNNALIAYDQQDIQTFLSNKIPSNDPYINKDFAQIVKNSGGNPERVYQDTIQYLKNGGQSQLTDIRFVTEKGGGNLGSTGGSTYTAWGLDYNQQFGNQTFSKGFEIPYTNPSNNLSYHINLNVKNESNTLSRIVTASHEYGHVIENTYLTSRPFALPETGTGLLSTEIQNITNRIVYPHSEAMSTAYAIKSAQIMTEGGLISVDTSANLITRQLELFNQIMSGTPIR